MQIQNDARSVFDEICEDAQDIYYEAKEQTRNKAQSENAEDDGV
jgi:hypothetical protein